MNIDPEIQNPSPFDEIPAPSLSKLPFIIGDVILVGSALAIWATRSPLSTGSTLLCLAAVALGALLFVLPYAMEYFTRAQSHGLEMEQSRAEGGQRFANLEANARQLARSAAEAQEHAARATAALDNVTRRLETRLAPLTDIQKNLITAVTDLQATAARDSGKESKDLQRENDRLRFDQADKILEATAKLAAIAAQLQALLDRPAPAAATASSDPALTSALTDLCERIEKISGSSPSVTTPVTAAVADKSPAPESNSSMLAKALSTAQPAEDSPAVARIIQSRPRKPRKPKTESTDLESTPPAAPGEVSSPAPAEPIPAAAEPVPEPAAAEAPAAKESWEALSTGTFDTVTGSSETPLEVHEPPPASKRRSKRAPKPVIATEPPPAANAPETPEPTASVENSTAPNAPATADVEMSTPAVALEEPSASAVAVAEPAVAEVIVAEPAVAETVVLEPAAPVAVVEVAEDEAPKIARAARSKARALLADDDEEEAKPVEAPAQVELIAPTEEPVRKRKSKHAADAPSLVAKVLIGIGNKPYVRGEGPGLSADKGVPMEFVEIGQWRWVAPESASGPISVRILKNDEIPADGDPITLKPGQALEVSPVFPG